MCCMLTAGTTDCYHIELIDIINFECQTDEHIESSYT